MEVDATLTADEYFPEASCRTGEPHPVYVRLIGLVDYPQFNGHEVVLKGQDPNNSEKCTLVVDGEDRSVHPKNFELF